MSASTGSRMSLPSGVGSTSINPSRSVSMRSSSARSISTAPASARSSERGGRLAASSPRSSSRTRTRTSSANLSMVVRPSSSTGRSPVPPSSPPRRYSSTMPPPQRPTGDPRHPPVGGRPSARSHPACVRRPVRGRLPVRMWSSGSSRPRSVRKRVARSQLKLSRQTPRGSIAVDPPTTAAPLTEWTTPRFEAPVAIRNHQ